MQRTFSCLQSVVGCGTLCVVEVPLALVVERGNIAANPLDVALEANVRRDVYLAGQ